jgi:hypothetical protein
MNRQQIMAHKLQIPVELEFNIPRVEWTIRKAAVELSRCEHSEDLCAKLSLLEPSGFVGLFDIAPLSALPLEQRKKLPSEDEFKQMPPKTHPAVFKMIGKDIVEVLHCRIPESATAWPKGEYRPLDPWRMRDEFLRLDHSIEELVKFLNKHGNWSRRTDPRRGLWRASVVLPNEIWGERETIVRDLRAGQGVWFQENRRRPEMFYVRGTFPYFGRSDSFCKDALETALMVDFLRGIRFRACSRRDCAIPFEIQTKHKRRYCTQYCAHLESVRRNRRKRAKNHSGKVK